MRKSFYLLLILVIPIINHSQNKSGLEICVSLQSNNFTTDKLADSALNKVLSVTGLSKNFVLMPCDEISNAIATSYKGVRYILYDKNFMKLITEKTNDWSNLSILAHEVGHHVNGHALDLTMYKIVEPSTIKDKHKQELEADEFSGFVLQKLGATLSQAQAVMNKFSSDEDDTYSTHPSREKRLNAIKIGFDKSFKMSSSNETISIKKPIVINKIQEIRMKLWAGIKADGDFSKSFEEFENIFCCNNEKQLELWFGLVEDNYYTKSFEDFKTQFFSDYID